MADLLVVTLVVPISRALTDHHSQKPSGVIDNLQRVFDNAFDLAERSDPCRNPYRVAEVSVVLDADDDSQRVRELGRAFIKHPIREIPLEEV